MTWVQCKNETEKLAAIKNFCVKQIENNNYNIASYEADRECILDYADEIHALKIANNRFEKILEIIDANEHTCIML